jgi:hypothetical protein
MKVFDPECHHQEQSGNVSSAKTEHTEVGWEGLVGATGFEPATPCAQGRCATRLRYAPTILDYSNRSALLGGSAGRHIAHGHSRVAQPRAAPYN